MSSSNGNGTSHAAVHDSAPPPAREAFAGADAIAALRTKPANVLLFRGLGPLVAAIVLFVLMLVIAPSVAPEHIVEKPVNATPTTVSN